jgi:hypothetical protein
MVLTIGLEYSFSTKKEFSCIIERELLQLLQAVKHNATNKEQSFTLCLVQSWLSVIT